MSRRASAYPPPPPPPPAQYCTVRAQHQVQHRLPLDGVVGESAPVLEQPARKGEPLLVGRDPLLVLVFAFHHVDGVARLHLMGDGLARQGLDKDLHAAAHARIRPGVLCTNIARTSSHRAPLELFDRLLPRHELFPHIDVVGSKFDSLPHIVVAGSKHPQVFALILEPHFYRLLAPDARQDSYRALVKEKQRTFIETLPLIERVGVVVHALLTWYHNRG